MQAIGFIFESIADFSKSAFNDDPKNKVILKFEFIKLNTLSCFTFYLVFFCVLIRSCMAREIRKNNKQAFV